MLVMYCYYYRMRCKVHNIIIDKIKAFRKMNAVRHVT